MKTLANKITLDYMGLDYMKTITDILPDAMNFRKIVNEVEFNFNGVKVVIDESACEEKILEYIPKILDAVKKGYNAVYLHD